MRIVILTTETSHHLFFVKKVSAFFGLTGIAVEKEGAKPPFETHHPFEDKRDQYERMELLQGKTINFNDYCETREFNNINE